MCQKAKLGTVRLSAIILELVREAPAGEGGRNTDLDDFGYQLPFFHPTGDFRLECQQYADALVYMRSVAGAYYTFLYDLVKPFFAVLNFVGGELKLSCKHILMTPGGIKRRGRAPYQNSPSGVPVCAWQTLPIGVRWVEEVRKVD
jgi:hypothetical protein